MFVLTTTEKLIILVGCAGLLLLVIIITLCFVCTSCYINKKIRAKNRRHAKKLEYLRNSYPLSFLEKSAPPPYEATSTTNQSYLSSSVEFNRRSLNSISSACSDTDSITGIPLPCLNDIEITEDEIKETENTVFNRGYVNISLQYKRITGQDKSIFPQLRIDLKEAGELPYRMYGGRCSPYFIITIYDYKGFRKNRRRSCEHQFFSTVVKKSQNPVFNESFFFPMEKINLKKCVLKLESWDQDKITNDTILGEVTFNLKNIASSLLQEPSKEFDISLKLEDSKMNNGQILLGLCYLPTAERMTVTVLKASNLKLLSNGGENTAFYVQAMAIHAGKIFERRKTSSRPSSPFPVFNEMLMFDVPFSKLEQVVILLAVYTTVPRTHPSDGENQHPSKDLCLGKVVIGSSSNRKNNLNQWHAMRNSPRRQIIQWHKLK